MHEIHSRVRCDSTRLAKVFLHALHSPVKKADLGLYPYLKTTRNPKNKKGTRRAGNYFLTIDYCTAEAGSTENSGTAAQGFRLLPSGGGLAPSLAAAEAGTMAVVGAAAAPCFAL